MSLSILELGRVRHGASRRTALQEACTLAQHAERLGYRRLWVAEHHNMAGVTTAATAVVIGYLAAATTTLRIGAGGIMLPNHAPYVIAEQFGTLAELYPGRIDLGLGRAPGTDQRTLRALRRDPAAADRFPQDVLELQDYLAACPPGAAIEAVPGSGTEVPLWILGSSLFGARLAAELGLPYGFASHFAPQALDAAVALYRSHYQPSRRHPKPYVLVGVNVVAAESDAQARRLATSQQMSFTDLVRGGARLLKAPIDDMEGYWLPHERAHVEQMLACSVVGGPETVRAGLAALRERTGADELMVVSDLYDPALRLRSFELIAQTELKEAT